MTTRARSRLVLVGSRGASNVKHVQHSAHLEVDLISIYGVYGSKPGLPLTYLSLRRQGQHIYTYIYSVSLDYSTYTLLCVNVFFLLIGVLFSSGGGSFLVFSAPGHEGSPPELHGVSVGLGRGPWHALSWFKVASNHGEAFRARRAIQAHANPRTS